MPQGVTGSLHFSIAIDGDRELSRTLHGYLGRVSDWKPFFETVQADWTATMRAKFAAEGAMDGEPAWAPLSEVYARWKARKYPGKGILVRTGALELAATEPEADVSATELRLTIDNPYAIYHQSSRPRTSNLPRRPFASLTRRQKTRWMRALRQHIWDEE